MERAAEVIFDNVQNDGHLIQDGGYLIQDGGHFIQDGEDIHRVLQHSTSLVMENKLLRVSILFDR